MVRNLSFVFFSLATVMFVDGIDVQSKQKCLNCICKVESGCKALDCHNDAGSLSCGYYQLKRPYYLDCGQPDKKAGESTDVAWKRCSKDKECATKCVNKYLDRYSLKCHANPDCQVWSRVHNGGPQGCKSGSTIPYWTKVKSCL